MVGEYYLFILLIIIVILCCISCCIGLRVRRRRLAAAAVAEQRYSQFAEQPNTNNGAYTQANGLEGNYGNLYYQQQQQEPPQVGVVTGLGNGNYFPTGSPQNYASPQSGGQPMSATVLYAGAPGPDGTGINFGNYFPEAQATNAAGNRPSNAYYGNTTTSSAQADASPYGEANYVSRPPPPPPPPAQQQQHQQQQVAGTVRSETRQPLFNASPTTPAGNAAGSVPPPQYPL